MPPQVNPDPQEDNGQESLGLSEALQPSPDNNTSQGTSGKFSTMFDYQEIHSYI